MQIRKLHVDGDPPFPCRVGIATPIGSPQRPFDPPSEQSQIVRLAQHTLQGDGELENSRVRRSDFAFEEIPQMLGSQPHRVKAFDILGATRHARLAHELTEGGLRGCCEKEGIRRGAPPERTR